jgi:formylglycine-generating enzyme required for sulfatase activity
MNREAPDLPTEAWTRLEQVLERFEDAWKRGERPALDEYLCGATPAERRALLIELAQEELEFRLKAGEAARVEEYLRRYPELTGDRRVVLDLIAAEHAQRRRREPRLTTDDYLRRFPSCQEELRTLLKASPEGVAGSASVATLVQALRDGGLLQPVQLQKVVRDLQARSADPHDLARLLVRWGWLTGYQAERLLQGRGRELVLGPYVLLELLGQGGMGQVFKARHRLMKRVVALKVIRKELVGDADAVARFHREVEAVAQLSHPNVVTAYDAGQAGDVHFFAMEYVEGTDLARLVADRGPLPVAVACDYVRQAALGLQHAFERGLVHRDVKPQNLLLAAAGSAVKVLDLGLARLQYDLADDKGRARTQLGWVMGTPDYMSPEQTIDSHRVDIRGDLYSLGCTLYFLLTGRAPFTEGSLADKMQLHRSAEPPAVEGLRPEVPLALAAVVRRLMAKRPAERFQRPAEVAAALEPFVAAVPVAVPLPPQHPDTVGMALLQSTVASPAAAGNFPEAVPVVAAPPAAPLPVATPVSPPSARARRRWRTWAVAVTLLFAGLLGLVFWFGLRAPREEITNSIGMRLVRIPPGKFTMGSSSEEIKRCIQLKLPWPPPEWFTAEGPDHEVEITRPFYMGKYEVTVGQFRQFVEATRYPTEAETKGGAPRPGPKGWVTDAAAYWEHPGFDQTDDHPVVCVSWIDASKFCEWLSKKEGPTYRLPSEAEWEYCCRAGTTTRFSCGDDDSCLQGFANLADKSLDKKWPGFGGPRGGKVAWDDGYAGTAPVGRFKPNAWGLHDMHGNALEWCQDVYDANSYKTSPRKDPRGADAGDVRVARGGCWNSEPAQSRSAFRYYYNAHERWAVHGFRVLLEVPGPR